MPIRDLTPHPPTGWWSYTGRKLLSPDVPTGIMGSAVWVV